MMQPVSEVMLWYVGLYCALTIATCKNSTELSTELSCKVDCRGTIRFSMKIPIQLKANFQNISFYYWNERSRIWRKQEHCDNYYEESYTCRMSVLTRTADESVITFMFSAIIFSNNIKYSITKFNFSGKINHDLLWTTTDSFTECKNSFGTKLISLEAGRKNIKVDWIQYPLPVINQLDERTTLIINNTEINYFDRKEIDLFTICEDDICSYNVDNLKPCTIFEVCVKTLVSHRKTQLRCRNIQTHCVQIKTTFNWQEILLILFGTIIVLACIILFGVLFQRFRKGHNLPEKNDAVFPRSGVNTSSCLGNSSNNVYHYPEMLLVNEVNISDEET